MAGGASSRMKKSVKNEVMDESVRQIASLYHKSLIPLGKQKKPLLVRLIEHAILAGYNDVYIVTGPDNAIFRSVLNPYTPFFEKKNLRIHYAIQETPLERSKPWGTADAVWQALQQFPQLKQTHFTLCNGDNLYSVKAMKQLLSPRKTPHALIAYALSGLNFSKERMARFALLAMEAGYLNNIIEKPSSGQWRALEDKNSELYVSMNLFSFQGALLLPYLEKCPLHPERNEKELPFAVDQMVQEQSKWVWCYPVTEPVPDLTSVVDIDPFIED